jgi:hypothetical protein
MPSDQLIRSPLTGRVSFRVQVRIKGWPSQSATFRNRRQALKWGASRDAPIREDRYFPQARVQCITFGDLARRYCEMLQSDCELDPNRVRHARWWESRLSSLALAAITPDRIAEARDALAGEPFTREPFTRAQRRGAWNPTLECLRSTCPVVARSIATWQRSPTC